MSFTPEKGMKVCLITKKFIGQSYTYSNLKIGNIYCITHVDEASILYKNQNSPIFIDVKGIENTFCIDDFVPADKLTKLYKIYYGIKL